MNQLFVSWPVSTVTVWVVARGLNLLSVWVGELFLQRKTKLPVSAHLLQSGECPGFSTNSSRFWAEDAGAICRTSSTFWGLHIFTVLLKVRWEDWSHDMLHLSQQHVSLTYPKDWKWDKNQLGLVQTSQTCLQTHQLTCLLCLISLKTVKNTVFKFNKRSCDGFLFWRPQSDEAEPGQMFSPQLAAP